jgi:hypothetical protein
VKGERRGNGSVEEDNVANSPSEASPTSQASSPTPCHASLPSVPSLEGGESESLELAMR